MDKKSAFNPTSSTPHLPRIASCNFDVQASEICGENYIELQIFIFLLKSLLNRLVSKISGSVLDVCEVYHDFCSPDDSYEYSY